ncbi:hypothetical protein GGI20_001642 [Coemansia sp. BCRC 34301]|nr:hypothetical protein GGI20_001642 [Coemansia sp. BCRC 34301]
MKLPTAIVVLASLGFTAFGHQGCDIDTALSTLLGEATVSHISEAILHSLQHEIKNAIQDVENITPHQIVDTIVDRYRVLQGILSYAGINLPLI